MRWRTALTLGALAGFVAGLTGVAMVELTRPAQAVPAGPIAVDFRLSDAAGRSLTAKDFAGRWLLIDLDQPGCTCDRPARLAAIGQAMRLMGRRSRELAIVSASPDPAQAPLPVSETAIDSLTGPAEDIARLRGSLAAHNPTVPLLVLLHPDSSLDRTIEGPIESEQLAKDLLKYLTRGY
ncbi:MAG TPA: SCO family protein [Aliidongia sp.]|nr:SCO family protein [Aliidongia sp.]